MLPINLLFLYTFYISTALCIFLVIWLLGALLFQKKQDTELQKQKAFQASLNILEDARLRSFKILTDSQSKAQKSIKDIKQLSDANKRILAHSMEKLYEKHAEVLRVLSKKLEHDYVENMTSETKLSMGILSEATADLKSEIITQVGELKDTLVQKAISTEDSLTAMVKEKYANLDIELAEYKEKKLTQLRAELADTVTLVCSKMLAREVSLEEHEKLMLDIFNEEVQKVGL